MTDISINFMIESITKDLILLLMEDRGLTMSEAFNSLYMSETYAKLKNQETGLYSQSTPYIYEYLIKEITTGKIS